MSDNEAKADIVKFLKETAKYIGTFEFKSIHLSFPEEQYSNSIYDNVLASITYEFCGITRWCESSHDPDLSDSYLESFLSAVYIALDDRVHNIPELLEDDKLAKRINKLAKKFDIRCQGLHEALWHHGNIEFEEKLNALVLETVKDALKRTVVLAESRVDNTVLRDILDEAICATIINR